MNTILQLGHLGLIDSVPLLVAEKHGFFAAAGLQVELSCELGLASLSARLAEERLAGACVPAPLPLLLSLGLGRPRLALEQVSFVSYQNLAIAAPRFSDARPRCATRPLRLGVLGAASPSRFVLQRWLEHHQRSAEEITLVPMALSQLLAFLGEGLIDGFCAEEPLPSLAASGEFSVAVSSSGTVLPMHPGSVVVLRTNLDRQRPELRAALRHALQRACRYCAEPSHEEELWALLRQQPPLVHLQAENGRLDEPGATKLPPALPHSDVRHVAPTTSDGVDAAGAAFLEQACRSMAGANGRGVDFRAEVARFYGAAH